MTQDLNAADFLLTCKQKNRVALRLPEGDFTFGDLQDGAKEFAFLLLAAGHSRGDRVLLLSVNSFHWVAAYLGILKAGLVCVPLPANLAPEELAYYLEATEACAAFVHLPLLVRHNAILADAGLSIFCEKSMHLGSRDRNLRWFRCAQPAAESIFWRSGGEAPPAGLASLMFTSGSTGRPRGVMVSHGNLIANTKSILASLSLSEHERMMTVLPFYYCFGTSLLHTYLKAGAMLVVDNRFTYPEVVLERMAKTQCTSFAGVPSHYQILLRNSSFGRKPLPHLLSLLQAGGHLAPSFVHQLKERVPQARIFIMYGQTEATARLACLPPEMLSSKPGSIGKAIPGVRLSIVKLSGEKAEPGEIGEIVAEGENITLGYWRAPDETAATFRDGRLHTGDMATMDHDGFLYVVDRAREFVKCGGIRISCRQIEDSLLESPDLVEAAVVAITDEVLGEAVRAFVVPRQQSIDGVAERVRKFCSSHLPRNMIPRDIIVIPCLPHNSYGKVLRPQLKTLASEEPGDRHLELATSGS